METGSEMALGLALESAPVMGSVMAQVSALGMAQDLAQGSVLATVQEKALA
jgi:hypothetical protein